MKLKIGDRVAISSSSKFYNCGKNNPVDEIGKVVSTTDNVLPVKVRWSASSNNYNESDLILVEEQDDIVEVELIVTAISCTVFIDKNGYVLDGDGTFSSVKATPHLRTGIKKKYNKTKKVFMEEQ